MFQALEDVVGDRELRSLSELCSLGLALEMDVLHPAVMVAGGSLGDVLLEDDDVGIGDFFGI
jgi:hypothetical protein